MLSLPSKLILKGESWVHFGRGQHRGQERDNPSYSFSVSTHVSADNLLLVTAAHTWTLKTKAEGFHWAFQNKPTSLYVLQEIPFQQKYLLLKTKMLYCTGKSTGLGVKILGISLKLFIANLIPELLFKCRLATEILNAVCVSFMGTGRRQPKLPHSPVFKILMKKTKIKLFIQHYLVCSHRPNYLINSSPQPCLPLLL